MPSIKLTLTDWPNAEGGIAEEVEVSAPIDATTAGGVLQYINARAGYRNAAGDIISAEQAAGDADAVQRTLEDVAGAILVSLAASYVRDAADYLATVNTPTLTAPGEGDVTATRVDA